VTVRGNVVTRQGSKGSGLAELVKISGSLLAPKSIADVDSSREKPASPRHTNNSAGPEMRGCRGAKTGATMVRGRWAASAKNHKTPKIISNWHAQKGAERI